MFPVMHLFVKSTTKPTNKAIAWNFLETSTANNSASVISVLAWQENWRSATESTTARRTKPGVIAI